MNRPTERSKTQHIRHIALLLLLTLGLLLTNHQLQAAGSGPLHQNGRIFGIVRDPVGRIVPNVAIEVVSVDGTDAYGGYAYTDDKGRFEAIDLPYGAHTLLFRTRDTTLGSVYLGGSPNRADAQSVVIENGDVHWFDVVLPFAGYVDATISSSEGSHLDAITVYAHRWDGTDWALYRSDSFSETYQDLVNGHLRFGGLPAGDYRLELQHYTREGYINSFYGGESLETATTVSVAAERATRITIPFDFPYTNQIRGRVTAEATNAKLRNINVSLYRFNEADGTWSLYSADNSNSEGSYRFINLRAGHYKLRFIDYSYPGYYAPEFNADQSTLGSAPVIVLTDKDNVTVDAALAQGGSVSGSAEMYDGTPILNVNVKAYRQDGAGDWLETDYAYSSYNKADWSMQQLPVGRYKFQFHGLADGFGPIERWIGGSTFDDATIVELGTSEKKQLPAMTISAAIEVFGTVRDLDWNRLPNVEVSLYKLSGRYNSWQLAQTTTTAADGTYRFDQLPAGGYTIGAHDSSTVHPNTYLGSKYALKDAIGFRLDSGVRSADIFMPPASSIQGSVGFTGDGTVSRGVITMAQIGNPSFYRRSSEAVDGRMTFNFDGLPPGEYRLRFDVGGDDSQGNRLWADQYYGGSENADEAVLIKVDVGETVMGVSAEIEPTVFPSEENRNSVSGQVTDGESPLSGITVHLFHYQYYRGNVRFWASLQTTTTDANGNYRFSGLGSNEYRIGFSDSSNRFTAEYFNDTLNFDNADIMSLTVNDHASGVNAELSLTQTPQSNSAVNSK